MMAAQRPEGLLLQLWRQEAQLWKQLWQHLWRLQSYAGECLQQGQKMTLPGLQRLAGSES